MRALISALSLEFLFEEKDEHSVPGVEEAVLLRVSDHPDEYDEVKLTRCIDKVWLMWMTAKSMYRLIAPGYRV